VAPGIAVSRLRRVLAGLPRHPALGACQIIDVGKPAPAEQHGLRAAPGQAAAISAADAIVAAYAGTESHPVVLTSDPSGMR
jgi:hypothetical protein